MSIHQRLWLRAFPIFVRLFLSAANIFLFSTEFISANFASFSLAPLPFENFNWTRQRFRLLPSLDGFIKSKVDFIKCAVKLNVLPIKLKMTARHLLDTFFGGTSWLLLEYRMSPTRYRLPFLQSLRLCQVPLAGLVVNFFSKKLNEGVNLF